MIFRVKNGGRDYILKDSLVSVRIDESPDVETDRLLSVKLLA